MSARTRGRSDVPWRRVSRHRHVAVISQDQAGVTASARDVVASVPPSSGGRRRERAAGLVAAGSALVFGMALPAVAAPPAAALARAIPVAAQGADPSQTFTFTGAAQTLTDASRGSQET